MSSYQYIFITPFCSIHSTQKLKSKISRKSDFPLASYRTNRIFSMGHYHNFHSVDRTEIQNRTYRPISMEKRWIYQIPVARDHYDYVHRGSH